LVSTGKGRIHEGEDRFETAGQPDRTRRIPQALRLISRIEGVLLRIREEIDSAGSAIPLYSHQEIFPLLSSIFISDTLEFVKRIREEGENSRRAVELAQSLIEQGISLLARLDLSEGSL
jgi:hypothetical protein